MEELKTFHQSSSSIQENLEKMENNIMLSSYLDGTGMIDWALGSLKSKVMRTKGGKVGFFGGVGEAYKILEVFFFFFFFFFPLLFSSSPLLLLSSNPLPPHLLTHSSPSFSQTPTSENAGAWKDPKEDLPSSFQMLFALLLFRWNITVFFLRRKLGSLHNDFLFG